jgi:phosphoadenosine phosphosulfate reductase
MTAPAPTSPDRAADVPDVLPRTPEQLQALAEQGAEKLAGASAEDVLRWTFDTFGDGAIVAASMGDTVVAHLASVVHPGVELLFLDTGFHFPETIGTADAVETVYDVRLRRVSAELTLAEQEATYGPRLYERDPDLCCSLRKVTPLQQALSTRQAWVTGLRRAESVTRAGAQEISWDARRGLVKVNPIVAWSDDDVERYAAENGVLRNPLLDDGYPSIGCAPCTRRVAPGEDARAGRWAGFGKKECGIHL